MKLGVIGAGTMGRGIAQVGLTNQCEVVLFDRNSKALETTKTNHKSILERLIKKGKLNGTPEDYLQNITYTQDLNDFKGVDFSIEAIVENLDVKKELFKTLEHIVSKDSIIATNTSSLSIASIASALENPSRCLGVHFFNPAPVMPLVEIIPAVQTSGSVFENVFQIIKSWGKVAVKAKDTPGFIVNRVARPFYGEALRILEEGIADVPTIDWAMTSLGKFRMGPFQLMDFIGNDVNYTVTETVFQSFYNDPRYKPSFTQKRLAEAGYLGRKSGKGYYDYDNFSSNPKATKDEVLGHHILNRILVMLINEAADAYYLNIASAEDIDLAMEKGVNYPKGLLKWANEKGITWCKDRMDDLYHLYHEDRYRCSPILRKYSEDNTQFPV
jgi:3-hydroxybutyryl-CoA dehydrogenase